MSMTTKDGLPVVPRGKLSYERDARYHCDGRWFTGWALSATPRAREEQEFRDGFRWGPARAYNGGGTLIVETNFRMDLQHGSEREWSDAGALIREAQHEHGILLSEKEWDENGVLTREFQRPDVDAQLAEMRRLYGTPEEVAAEEEAYRRKLPPPRGS
jgi:hypothetical protein